MMTLNMLMRIIVVLNLTNRYIKNTLCFISHDVFGYTMLKIISSFHNFFRKPESVVNSSNTLGCTSCFCMLHRCDIPVAYIPISWLKLPTFGYPSLDSTYSIL